MTPIFSWLVDRACDWIGPTIKFPTSDLESRFVGLPPVAVSCPPRGTVTAAAAPHAQGSVGNRLELPWLGDGGRGHHIADNCIFVETENHWCTNSFGDPILPHQDCYPSARAESLRSFREAHRWFADMVPEPDGE